jgi:PAS domain S-box-containing protein
MERHLTYRTRLLATFVGPWLLAVLFSFVYLTHIQRVAGDASARRHLEVVSDMLAFSVASGLSEGNFALVQKAFDWSRIDTNVVYIGILDEEYEVIFQTSTDPPVPLASISRERHGISAIDAGMMSIAPVVEGNKRIGTVVLVYSLAGVEREVRAAQTTAVVVSILLFLVGLLGTRLLARQTAEVEAARAEAERQALTVHAQADALRGMNETLERRNAELHSAQNALQRAHDDLEERVVERTAALAEANSALRLNQMQLGMAMLAARMAPWKFDVESGQITITEEWREVLGVSSNQAAELLARIHGDDREALVSQMRRVVNSRDSFAVEFRVIQEDGTPAWYVTYGRAMATGGSSPQIVGILVDINEQKRSEEVLRTSLNEKEILLKEVHHRVKNNMQVISSLLSLQSNHVRDPFDAELFHESQMRVKSMAIVHERLYRSPDLSSIEFGEYVQAIVKELLHSYRRPGVQFKTSIDKIRFGVDTAIPCGLLINELVTNSIKHAFPDDRQGTVEISATRESGRINLSVADDGVGLPDTMDFTSEDTLGVTIIRALTDQIDGMLTVDRVGGTRITISFPLSDADPG